MASAGVPLRCGQAAPGTKREVDAALFEDQDGFKTPDPAVGHYREQLELAAGDVDPDFSRAHRHCAEMTAQQREDRGGRHLGTGPG